MIHASLHRAFLTFSLLFLVSALHGQYKRSYTEKIDTFPDGQVQRITRVWVKTFEDPPIHDWYIRTKTKVVEYFSDGTTKLEETKVELNASWGKPCNEVLYKKRTFYKDGKKKYFELRKCDQEQTITREYNKKGRLVRRKKIIYRWRKEDK